MILNLLDQLPLWEIYILILVILFLSAEMGFYIGKFRKARIIDAGGSLIEVSQKAMKDLEKQLVTEAGQK